MDFLNQLFQMTAKDLLALGVIGTIIATIGSFFAMVVKEYFFARSFEEWKTKRTLETVYQKYSDPLILTAKELCRILLQICNNYPTNFLDQELLTVHPNKIVDNSIDDVYFRKYKLVSAIYRLCAFLGWLELYRQEIVFLDSGKSDLNNKLESCLHNIRDDLADGKLNNADDWMDWSDALLFREEQRAIGEAMIPEAGNTKVIIGYGKFCELLNAEANEGKVYWIKNASNFFLHSTKGNKDFRIVRMRRLAFHLITLLELLDNRPLPNSFIEYKKEYQTGMVLT